MKVFLNHVKELTITAGYGNLDSVHKTPHTGIDIAFNLGDPILSPVNGIISRVVDYGSTNIGKGVMIKLDNGKELIFGHCSNILVHKGQHVTIGQEIALAGSTGRSTGTHLHLGLKDLITGHFLDPTHYFILLQQTYSHTINHIYASDNSHLYHAVSNIIQAFTN